MKHYVPAVAASSALALVLSFGAPASEYIGVRTLDSIGQEIDAETEAHLKVSGVFQTEIEKAAQEVDHAREDVAAKEAALEHARDNADIDAHQKEYRAAADDLAKHALSSINDAAKPNTGNPLIDAINGAKKAEVGAKAVEKFGAMKEAESAYIAAAMETADPTELLAAEKVLAEAKERLREASETAHTLEFNRQTMEEVHADEEARLQEQVREAWAREIERAKQHAEAAREAEHQAEEARRAYEEQSAREKAAREQLAREKAARKAEEARKTEVARRAAAEKAAREAAESRRQERFRLDLDRIDREPPTRDDRPHDPVRNDRITRTA